MHNRTAERLFGLWNECFYCRSIPKNTVKETFKEEIQSPLIPCTATLSFWCLWVSVCRPGWNMPSNIRCHLRASVRFDMWWTCGFWWFLEKKAAPSWVSTSSLEHKMSSETVLSEQLGGLSLTLETVGKPPCIPRGPSLLFTLMPPLAHLLKQRAFMWWRLC